MVPGLSTITVNREPLHSRAAHGATGSQTRFSEHITGKDRPQWHSSKRARLVPMYRRTSNWPSLTEPKQGRVSYNIRASTGKEQTSEALDQNKGPPRPDEPATAVRILAKGDKRKRATSPQAPESPDQAAEHQQKATKGKTAPQVPKGSSPGQESM